MYLYKFVRDFVLIEVRSIVDCVMTFKGRGLNGRVRRRRGWGGGGGVLTWTLILRIFGMVSTTFFFAPPPPSQLSIVHYQAIKTAADNVTSFLQSHYPYHLIIHVEEGEWRLRTKEPIN